MYDLGLIFIMVAGGIALVYVSQPLDTVKVKMQTFPETYKKGMVDCAVRTFQKDGVIKGLYAGTLPAVAANVAENSVLFAGEIISGVITLFKNTKFIANLKPNKPELVLSRKLVK